ncbi:hypothetical protein KVR01_000326 [Diaporthe batatas]|uniref:uncharacterized protein n=1 Tax=Diaporthe batatas TaxID=748121 RepID=UPI001D04FC2C|nr:uncharacterized protein KVR01_000326 [Diaporthe batatas]KAG8169581.1 hypothetical protein KVR01_000326 [Diaporthe batatas]
MRSHCSDMPSTETASDQVSVDDGDRDGRIDEGTAVAEASSTSHIDDDQGTSPDSTQCDPWEEAKDLEEVEAQWNDVLKYMKGEKPPEYDARGLVPLWLGRNDSTAEHPSLIPHYFDIVVVHGFWGARRPPWKNPGSGNSSWLHRQGYNQHQNVVSFGYDPMTMLSGTCTHEVMKNLAMTLLEDIKRMKKSSTQMRGLMFIAHDVGGSIVKCALAQAQLNPLAYGFISDATRLLLFYGCPHRATNLRDMEQRLSKFVYRRKERRSHKLRSQTSGTTSLAKAITAINDSYFLSKQMFRSYAISVFSGASNSNIDEVFGSFCGTLGSPFEFRIAGGRHRDGERYPIKCCIENIRQSLSFDKSSLRIEKALISLASPVPPLRTGDGLDKSYAWISENQQYQAWRSRRKPEILYLKGGSHARLASEYVLYDLEMLDGPWNRQFDLFFPFDRYDTRRDDALDMMATFLAQMLGHSPSSSVNACEPVYEVCRVNRGWHYNDALAMFQSCRNWCGARDISFVLVNFNECEPVSRKAFLDFFLNVSQTREWHWKIVVTSSRKDALAEELSNLPVVYLDVSAKGIATQKYHDRATDPHGPLLLRQGSNGQAAKKDVDQELEALEGLDPDVRDSLIQHAKSDHESPSKQSIRHITGSPERISLDSVLEMILKKVPDHKFASRTLAWALYAVRPLTHLEFANAVSFELNNAGPDLRQLSSQEADELIEKLQIWLAGVLSFENNTVALSTHHIRESLIKVSNNQSSSSHIWDSWDRNPHGVIAKTCLAYLATPAAQKSLARRYDNSLSDAVSQSTDSHDTSIEDYAVQYWIHHASQAPHGYDLTEDVARFVRSGVTTNWSKSYWSLANPFTRSPRPFTSLYPVLAGRGLVDLAESFRVNDEDFSDGLGEAYINRSSHSAEILLRKRRYSIDTVKRALTCAGGRADETAWEGLIEYISKEYAHFPWEGDVAQVVRASRLGLNVVLARLLELGCPADTPHDISGGPGMMARSVPLRQAVFGNNLISARLLLKYGADPHAANDFGLTALHLAAAYGHPDMVKFLGECHADLDAQTMDFRVPVYEACLLGCSKALVALLKLGANPNLKAVASQTEPGWSPLTCAVQEENVGCVRALLDAKADPEVFGPSGTPLWYAVGKGSFEICQLLLDHGADPNSKLNNLPMLRHAIRGPGYDSVSDIVKLLLEKGADIDEVFSGQTALVRACWSHPQQRHRIVRCLLQHGANVNLPRPKGDRPIHICVLEHDVETLQALLDHGSLEIDAERLDGSTALMCAFSCSNPKEEIVRNLLKRGADPNKFPHRDRSPLIEAIVRNRADIVTLLLQYNAQIDPNDELMDGWEPLERAVVNGYANIVRILADAGANINRRDDFGDSLVHLGIDSSALGALLEFRPALDMKTKDSKTPLHYIEDTTPLENIKLLVRAGSEINVTDCDGSTPLIAALRYGHGEGARYLMSKGADTTIISPCFGGPLHAACNMGLVEIVEDLVNGGADVNLSVLGEAGTPLSSIFFDSDSDNECKTRLIDILLKAGANINDSNSRFGGVSVAAVVGGEVEHLHALAARGASFAGRDISGRTPLHFAACLGRREMVSFIMANGGKHADKDNVGRSSISWAAEGGNTALLGDLLQLSGSDAINDVDLDGWTPLCWAARAIVDRRAIADEKTSADESSVAEEDAKPNLDMLKYLLDRGANPLVKARLRGKEYTPAGIARYHGCDNEVLELLAPRSEDRSGSADLESTSGDELDGNGMPEFLSHERSRISRKGCEFCGLRCRGLAYTCKVCPDFDYCYKCFNWKDKIHHANHEFEETGPELEFDSEYSESRSSSPEPSLSASTSDTSSRSGEDGSGDGEESADQVN